MKFNRRNFIKTAFGIYALSTCPDMLRWFASCKSRVLARTGWGYPGRIKPLNHRKIREVGKWLG